MTAAICTECGALKHGAWTPCPECQYDPSGKGLVEEARALFLTDHYHTLEQLEAASAAIRAGDPAPIDPAFVKAATAEAEAKGQTTLIPKKQMFLGCAVLVALAIVGVILVVRACS